MGPSAKIRQQLVENFKAEQSEHVQHINDGLLKLEKAQADDTRQALLQEIFRAAHSLKGAARAVGLNTIEGLGHALEDLLLAAKENFHEFTPEIYDLLYRALDGVGLAMDRFEQGDQSPPPEVLMLMAQLAEAKTVIAPNAEPAAEDDAPELPSLDLGQIAEPLPVPDDAPDTADEPDEPDEQAALPPVMSDETIRVSVGKLDALMAQFSELLGAKIRAGQRLTELREQQTLVTAWYKAWMSARRHYNKLVRHADRLHINEKYAKDMAAVMEFVAFTQESLRTLNVNYNGLYQQVGNDTLRLSLVIDALQEEIKRVRMLPLATITTTFGRMVRDLARNQHKQISLSVTGGDTELDKRVLEQIKDPLIHLLRNAVDHGLETPAERQQAGKAPEGTISLSASQQGNNVVITIRDDGHGLDVEAIRQGAVQRGLMDATEAAHLTDDEAAYLIFEAGFSTAKIITDISGRGVGLDIVRQNVEELHGTLDVTYEVGQGTTFTLTLPLTLASSHGLLVKVNSQTFALPLTTVERMLQVNHADINTVGGQEALIYQNKPVALAHLADLLELPPAPSTPGAEVTVVIVTVAEKRLGLMVDGLAGEQEIVMKSLGRQLAKVTGIAGATVLGAGQVILVLHTADLIRLASQQRARRVTAAAAPHGDTPTEQKRILVVDDSITTRTLEKNILEAAGYHVRTATNGEEALSMLAEDVPHVLISDVHMPRMDGLMLASHVKQDPRYKHIPLILVTSLDSPADKARGIQVGADAYIVKTSFDQRNLLDTIEQLV